MSGVNGQALLNPRDGAADTIEPIVVRRPFRSGSVSLAIFGLAACATWMLVMAVLWARDGHVTPAILVVLVAAAIAPFALFAKRLTYDTVWEFGPEAFTVTMRSPRRYPWRDVDRVALVNCTLPWAEYEAMFSIGVVGGGTTRERMYINRVRSPDVVGLLVRSVLRGVAPHRIDLDVAIIDLVLNCAQRLAAHASEDSAPAGVAGRELRFWRTRRRLLKLRALRELDGDERMLLAAAAYMVQRYPEALALVEEALEATPEAFEALLLHGACLARMKRGAAAVAELRKAAALGSAPHSAVAAASAAAVESGNARW